MQSYDLLVYCPLDEEFEVVSRRFPLQDDYTHQFGGSVVYGSAICDIPILVACGDKMGVSPAISLISLIEQKFQVKNILCLGIAGQIDDDLSIGDICYTGQNFDVTQSAKQTDQEMQLTSYPYKTNPKITTSLSVFRKHPNYIQHRADLNERSTKRVGSLGLSNVEHVTSDLKYLDGSIVTGPVNASDKFKKRLRKMDRKFLAIETEVGGVFEYFEKRSNTNIFTIRGISDLGDSTKNRFEAETKGKLRKLAIQNAVDFLVTNLNCNEFFKETISPSNENRRNTPKKLDITEITLRLNKQYSEKLKLLSPEFQTISHNYWVPAPRIMRIETSSDEARPVELITALNESSRISINLPVSYPDRGAAYLYAIELIGQTNAAGDIIIPIIVEAKHLHPPKRLDDYLALPSDTTLDEIKKLENVKVVLIFREISQHSENAENHIVQLIDESGYAAVRLDENNSSRHLPYKGSSFSYIWRQYNLSEVSFSNIAKFLTKNHDFDQVTAESLAYRLYQTLSQFKMQPHPSYFAGLSREMLYRLLETNSRSELIELAVIGLTMLSASADKNIAKISRTQRQAILREIVYKKNFEKQNLTANDVRQFIADHLRDRGIELSADKIWDSFTDTSLIIDNKSSISIGVPFVENYLLAIQLLEDKNLAQKYFICNNAIEDQSTFLLYCEMGGAENFIDFSMRNIDQSIDNFEEIIGDSAKRNPKLHALLDHNVGPAALKTPSSISKITGGLTKQAERILVSESELGNKQLALDMQQSLAEVIEEVEEPKKPDMKGRELILAHLFAGIAVLGGGAEHLSKKDKEDLASKAIKLVDMIADDWLRMIEDMKKSTKFHEVFESFKKDKEAEEYFEDEKDLERFIEFLFDIMQAGHYISVVPKIILTFEEVCGSRILQPIIRDAPTEGKTENLFKALWATVVDPIRNGNLLKDCFKQIPKHAFLRYVIAATLMESAYWLARSEDDRIELLALAEQSMAHLRKAHR